MNAIDLLKKISAKTIDYSKMFESQMADLEKMLFPSEIINLFREKKEALLEKISKEYIDGCIPFIPVVSSNKIEFIKQFKLFFRPYSDTGDIYAELNGFFYNEGSFKKISNLSTDVYFLINVDIENLSEEVKGCLDLKKYKQGFDVLNHVETAMVIHFSNLFENSNVIIAPGSSWDDYECPVFKKNERYNEVGIYCKNFLPSETGVKISFLLCQSRI